MSRFLFVVPPMTGHVHPTLPVAHVLRERGHATAWVGYGQAIGHLLTHDDPQDDGDGEAARLYSLDRDLPGDFLTNMAARAHNVRGLAGLKFLWDDVLLPLGRDMLDGVVEAARDFRADVLVVDQQAFAGAFAARRLELPWATLATTSADRATSLVDLPKVLEWTERRLADLQRELNLEPVHEPENSPACVIVFSTPELAGDVGHRPKHWRFVGPSLGHRAPATPAGDFPWDELSPGRRILVSLGTLNAERGGRFFAAVAEGLGGDPALQVILVAPEDGVDGEPMTPGWPENFLVRPWVPQLELLAHVDAVVCHGGHNTVCEALSEGLPLVVAPIKDDQPVIAQQVVNAGCGLRLSFTRPRPAALATAVARVLNEPSFAQAAEVVRSSFLAAGGADEAARLLEELA
jgi:MGT family glycosyltransferase